MQGDVVKKPYMKILASVFVIIYVCLIIIVTIKYIEANRYWEIDVPAADITVESGQNIAVEAKVKNKMYYVLGSKDNYFISYHIYDENGKIVQFDNPRTDIQDIEPGNADYVEINIQAPAEKGRYKLIIDIVKEGEYWFKDRGEKPGSLFLNTY
jgi:hypothetical protein